MPLGFPGAASNCPDLTGCTDQTCPPICSADFFDEMLEEAGQTLEIRRVRDADKVIDAEYGFDLSTPKPLRIKAIVESVSERDAKLIESGYAQIGDFKYLFSKMADVKTHDVVYDPLRNITTELVAFVTQPSIGDELLHKEFIARVQTFGANK